MKDRLECVWDTVARKAGGERDGRGRLYRSAVTDVDCVSFFSVFSLFFLRARSNSLWVLFSAFGGNIAFYS